MNMNKKYYIVVDTETLGFVKGKETNQMVFDLGYAVCDKAGLIYEQGSFLIKDFADRGWVQHMFYREKIGLYTEKLMKGEIESKYFNEVIEILNTAIAKYDIKDFVAYNLGFDKRVIQKTFAFLNGQEMEWFKCEDFDLYHVAAQLLLNKPSYKWLAEKHNKKTDKGNIQTGAEPCFSLISGDWDFIEEHTGLEDVKIEVKILSHCLRQKKKFDKSINSQSWRLVNQA